MKGKNLSKVLALLLACVMIFTTLPLMAFAADETEPYIVSYGAPAVLMNVDTIVDLNDLFFEMDAEGTVVSGADITWSAEKQDGLSFNVTNKRIAAEAKGTYKLTATVGDISKNIYVMVKTADETDFYLINKTLNQNTFVLEDWYLFDVNSGNAKTSVDSTTANYVKLGYGHMMLPKDEIFKDFADYTVEANVASNASPSSSSVKMGAGVAGRVYLDETNAWKTSYKGIVSFIMQDYRVGVRRPDDGKVFRELGTAKADLTNENKAWLSTTNYHDVKSVFSGSKAEFYYDNELLFTSTDAANYPCTDQIDPGYPAVTSYGSNAYVKSFKVKLNSNELAPTYVYVEPEGYTVSYAAPAIPMNENTGVDLNYVNVEMDAAGTVVSGADITWSAELQQGLYLNAEGKKVSVYTAGNYKLTATYEGVSKNVWVIAKKASETNFYLVNKTLNKNTFVLEDWYLFDVNSGSAKTSVDDQTQAGYIKLGYGHMMLPKDEIFKDFADYTVEANVASNASPNSTTVKFGAGVAGRVHLDETNAWNTNYKGIVSFIMQDYRVAVRLPDNTKVFRELGTAKADLTNENKAWLTNQQYHDVKSVFNGSTVEFYYDNEQLLTSAVDRYPCADQTAPGYPAVTGYGANTYVKNFKVYLNSNEMPEAIDAEEIKYNNVKFTDPVISMYKGTQIRLDNTTVQLKKDGNDYLASEVEWQLPEKGGVEIKDDCLIAYNNGIYALTATSEGISKKIYVFVVDKSDDEIILFNDDFSDKTLDYSVWQQTEYYWGVPQQVTAPKDITGVYTEGKNVAQIGAIPFVTTDYWDALEVGGPRSREEAGGTGYSWNNIFMNNAQYYAYIREDYVTEDGVKLSDLSIYDVSASAQTLNPGKNISEYKASTDTYGEIRMEYNGVGIMGRVNFAGESYFKKGTSSMHSFIWDGEIRVSAGSAKSNAATSYSLTNRFGTFSIKAEYREDKVVGRYIPLYNHTNYFDVPSYTTEVSTTDIQTGTAGFYTEARDIDIYDFTITYPINVFDNYSDVVVTAENNTVTVPVNTTVYLSKYSFSVGGKTVMGSDIAWSGVRNSVGELDTYNKTFTGFTAGTVTVNDVTFVVTDTDAVAGAASLVSVNGNGSVTVSPNTSTNSYTAKATANAGQLLKAGVINVTYEDGTVKTVPVDENGNAVFTVDHIGGISISANFVEKQELGFVSLGATIRLPGTKDSAGNDLKPGIRFGARLNNIRLSGDKAILDSEITIDGKDYKVAEVGSLIIPSRLLNGAELTVNSANVQKKRVTMASNTTENYADITAVLVGIPTTWYDLDISFRGYIKYTELDGTGEYYVYTDEIARSYNGVMKAAPVYETGAAFDTTNTSILLKASKSNIKYGLGEQMMVFADTYIGGTMANGIKLSYKIYAGNADGYSGSALATGTATSAANASVKISYKPENAGYYYVVVSALDADDNVVITDTIRLGAGIVSANGTNVFDEDNIALNFGVTSDTHIYGEYMNHGNNRNLRDALKIVNNQAGYYADGTQKLDAFLVAGDIVNSLMGTTNLGGLPGWKTADTVEKFDYLVYSETNAFRNIINDYVGDAQFLYSLGNHDSLGKARSNFIHGDYPFRSSLYYKQILSGKRVELPDAVADMTAEQIAAVHFDPSADYYDSKEYIRHYGRDEGGDQQLAQGNRVMNINGFTFISIEPITLQNGFARFDDSTLNFLKTALDESVARDPSAPIFIITHHRPYKTHGDAMGVLDTGSVNIDEILKDYPQAMIWGGHVHDSLQSETTIVQTRTVDENGNVISNGYTSLSSAACTSDTSGTHGSDATGGFVQLVQVDVNGNVRITKYSVGANPDNSDCEVDDAVAEITMGDDGQWIKAWSGDSSSAMKLIQTINNPWYIVNSVDDCVRDEYSVDARAAQFSIGFEAGSATLNGTTLTFKKAINKLGYNNENTTVTRYYAFLFDANNNNIETQVLSTNVAAYAKYTDMPDTYTINFNNTGAYVIIRAYDFWVAYLGTENQRYISNDAQIAVNQSQS